MRCLSPYSNYALQVIAPQVKRGVNQQGVLSEYQEGIEVIAQFRRTGLLEHEIEAALLTFNFGGLPENVNPLTRISVFDSEVYCEETYEDEETRAAMQERIDQRLVKLQEKRGQSEFIIVEAPLKPIPWPSYDKNGVEKILELQAELEIDPEVVRLYEEENKGRKPIIEAMLALEDPEAHAEEEPEVKEGATVGA